MKHFVELGERVPWRGRENHETKEGKGSMCRMEMGTILSASSEDKIPDITHLDSTYSHYSTHPLTLS